MKRGLAPSSVCSALPTTRRVRLRTPVGAVPRGRRYGCWRKVAAERKASRADHRGASMASPSELAYFGDNVPVRGAETISAIGVKCGAPAVELVQRDAEQLACPGRRKLPSSDVSEDGVLSRNAPAFACAGVFGGEGHSSPHRMITSPKLYAWPLPSPLPTTGDPDP